MIAPAIPADEQARVESLRALGLVDTDPEERFDALCRLAVRMFDVPISYISLMESDRQFIKSKVGMGACSTDRETSFCGHAIAERKTLVVPDTLADERFHDNPMVLGEPHTRFYCGRPLFSNEGYPVATLCLMDTQPRSITPEQLDQLNSLAQLAERELTLGDLLKSQHELLRTKDALLEAQREVSRQLDDAREYVLSLLPEPLEGRIRADYAFIPSCQLGGDSFGYHWIDDHRFAVYLLDVCGHGVGSALLSVSAMNTLRTGGLPGASFSDPAAVVSAMNKAYRMEEHGGLYFTLWYGVVDVEADTLSHSSAGHPPAILFRGNGACATLEKGGLPVGCMETAPYSKTEVPFHPGDALYVFSDGVFETPKAGGGMGSYAEFRDALTGEDTPGDLVRRARRAMDADTFPDDVSILRIRR